MKHIKCPLCIPYQLIGYVLEDFEEFERANGFLFPDPLTYMPGAHIRQMEDLEQFFLQIAKGEDEFKEQRAAASSATNEMWEESPASFRSVSISKLQ